MVTYKILKIWLSYNLVIGDESKNGQLVNNKVVQVYHKTFEHEGKKP